VSELARPRQVLVNPELSYIQMPLIPHAWETALVGHPDKTFVKYILAGLTQGFRIGFNRHCPFKSASTNMPSAREHPKVVERYISEELAKRHFLGPFPQVPCHGM